MAWASDPDARPEIASDALPTRPATVPAMSTPTRRDPSGADRAAAATSEQDRTCHQHLRTPPTMSTTTTTDLEALLADPAARVAAGFPDVDDLLDELDELEEAEDEEEEDDEEDEDDDNDDDDDADGRRGRGRSGKGQPKTFDRRGVMRERRRAAKEARDELLSTLGFSNLDEAKSFAEAARTRQQENESEADRKTREAEERDRRAAEREAAAAEREVTVTIKDLLRDSDVRKDRLDRALKSVLADLGDDLTKVDPETLEEAVAGLVEDTPEWFSGGDNNDDDDAEETRRRARAASRSDHGRSGGRGTQRTGGKSRYATGVERAEAELARRRARRGGSNGNNAA